MSSDVGVTIVVGVSLVKEGAVVGGSDIEVLVAVDAPVAELKTVENASDVEVAAIT